MGKQIKVAIVGVGNCASALIQGLTFYSQKKVTEKFGLMNKYIGGYAINDINIVCAIDVDARKVGKNINEAIFASPNCTHVFAPKLKPCKTKVIMGKVLDGVAAHMQRDNSGKSFIVSSKEEATKEMIINSLKKSQADVLVNYLPVGSEKATLFYIDSALKAGVGVVNCIPVFVASSPKWQNLFKRNKLPIIGDDIKSQVGATIIHRVLTDLLKKRGAMIEKMYQLNFGGNSDFLNMLDRTRLQSKKHSKTEAVRSQPGNSINDNNLHVGPSDFVNWLDDQKNALVKIEGTIFGGSKFSVEVKLTVEDSPNSAGVVIDAVRCCKAAMDRKIYGYLDGPSAYYMKHPAIQYDDNIAYERTISFINGQQY